MNRDDFLNISNKNFKYVQDSKLYKFKYMDSWCFEYSKFFRNEVDLFKSNKRKKYKTYKRGSIVYVKLGINIGDEFSGNHFCVVLDKSDNRFNSTLTVIPLTSKPKKYNVLIKEKLIQIFSRYIRKQYQALANDMLFLAKKYPKVELLDDPNLIKSINENEKKFLKLQDLEKRYERYADHDTYANILKITNISKDRINVLNEYDPIGVMSYSDTTMELIDKNIIKSLTRFSID